MKMQKIMIVDDEALVLLDRAMTVEDLGYEVFCDCTDIETALSCLEQETPDAALLDIDVGGTPVWPLARAMQERGCPFVFVSADSGHEELRTEFAGAALVDKPASTDELSRALQSIL